MSYINPKMHKFEFGWTVTDIKAHFFILNELSTTKMIVIIKLHKRHLLQKD